MELLRMAKRKRQQGQALVGVLVIMTLVFAFAGALAVAASGLLRDQESAFQPFTNDKLVRSTVAAAIAQATAAGSCSLAPLPAGLKTYVVSPYVPPRCQPITPLGDRLAHVKAFADSQISACPGGWCTSMPASTFLANGQAKAWLWFATRGRAVAWGTDDCDTCGPGNNNNCQSQPAPGFLSAPAYTITNGIPITQVALQLVSSPVLQTVCFKVDGPFPVGLRYADDHNESASQRVFNLIVPVGPNSLEEVDLYQSGAQARLQWEESL